MTEAEKQFAELLSDVGRTLATRGFRRKHKAFHAPGDNAWTIIEFQRSADSGPEAIVFTVNVGLAYLELPSIIGWNPAHGRPPKVWDCHVAVRIGHFLPDRSPGDYWWLVDADTDTQRLADTLSVCLDGPVMKFVEDLQTLEGLRRYWLRKAERGTIEDRELEWLGSLDASIDTSALAAKPERLARAKRHAVADVDFSKLPPLVIETRRS